MDKPVGIETEEELLGILNSGLPENSLNVDTSKLSYALYARKSTQGDDKQAKSLKQQIAECMDRVLLPNEITNVKIYQEKFSAKEPGTRAVFNSMLNDIRTGRINGLIAWHPDRLARNMKEAGEIIDLLDNKVIRDLKFATSTFENNPTGKMLLGISFVLSKQYSEHLSESVTRGNKRFTEDEGEFLGKFKHGYIVDTNRHLRPDEDTFTLVQEMFRKRLAGESQTEILKWIQSKEYKVRRFKKDAAAYNWDKDAISIMLRDPVYAGVLRYGMSHVILSEKYDFIPMISVEEYSRINNLDNLTESNIVSRLKVKSGDIQADMLRQMVYCGKCNQTLTANLQPKNDPRTKELRNYYFYYKCETSNCPLKGKNAKAGLIIDYAIDFFKSFLFVTKGNYEVFLKNAKASLKKNNVELDSQIARITKQIALDEGKYSDVKDLLSRSPQLQEHYDLNSQKKDIDEQKQEKLMLMNIRNQSKHSIPTYEEYLKLLKSTPVILSRMKDLKQVDKLLRIFFSNFTVHPINNDNYQGSRVTSELKEPWKGFIVKGVFETGAGTGTLTRDLFLGKEAL